MSISSLLLRSFDSAVLLCVSSGFVLQFAPRALRAWEKSLAGAAIHACAEQGGTALVGEDRVVSCAPSTLSNEREP